MPEKSGYISLAAAMIFSGCLLFKLIMSSSFAGYLREEKNTEIPEIYDVVQVELGDSVFLTADTFVSNLESSKIRPEYFSFESELKNSEEYQYYDTGYVVSRGKQYLDVGEYSVKIKYRKKGYSSVIKVVDTTAPEIENFKDTVYRLKGHPLDIDSIFRADDLSETTISYRGTIGIDTNNPGDYSATIRAEDIYGNFTEKQFTIKVIEPAYYIKSDNSYYTEGGTNSGNRLSGKSSVFQTLEEATAYGQSCIASGQAYGYNIVYNGNGTYSITLS